MTLSGQRRQSATAHASSKAGKAEVGSTPMAGVKGAGGLLDVDYQRPAAVFWSPRVKGTLS